MSMSFWMVPVRVATAVLVAIAVASVILAGGCRRPAGPPTFTVSGTVRFAGEPVPFGRIVFEPDAERGNSGPASVADITAGRYRTRPGRGFMGGACRATISGGDGTLPTEDHDTALFPPWTIEVDLPRADCTYDFVVPVRQ
jgi:hypothetical protein